MSDSESIDSAAQEAKMNDVSNPDILAKYKFAATVANRALTGVLTQCVDGKKVVDICAVGDSLISKLLDTSFKSKKIEKGIAFPTCISVNECVCHFSPLKGDETTLKTGDMVKIDLGCHVDGYIAVVAHAIVVGATEEAPVTGPKADVMMAASTALEAAYKLARPGNKSTQIVEAVDRIAKEFGVTSVVGTLSHQMKRFVIDGAKVVNQRVQETEKQKEFEFEVNEVYALDFCMSTGEGKPKEGETRCTVFRREVDETYKLKMKASRYLLGQVAKNHATMPFTLRAIEDEKLAKMGVTECVKHRLLAPYPVCYEKAGTDVAHFQVTIVITGTGTTKLTGLPVTNVKSDKTVGDDTKAILSLSSKTKKRKNRKKKAAAAAAAGGAGGAAGAAE